MFAGEGVPVNHVAAYGMQTKRSSLPKRANDVATARAPWEALERLTGARGGRADVT